MIVYQRRRYILETANIPFRPMEWHPNTLSRYLVLQEKPFDCMPGAARPVSSLTAIFPKDPSCIFSLCTLSILPLQFGLIEIRAFNSRTSIHGGGISLHLKVAKGVCSYPWKCLRFTICCLWLDPHRWEEFERNQSWKFPQGFQRLMPDIKIVNLPIFPFWVLHSIRFLCSQVPEPCRQVWLLGTLRLGIVVHIGRYYSANCYCL